MQMPPALQAAPGHVPALGKEPDYAEARKLLSNGDIKSGARLSAQMIKAKPNIADWHAINALFCLHDAQDMELVAGRSMTGSHTAERLEPGNPDIAAIRALVLFFAADYKLAEKKAKATLRVDPKNKRAKILALVCPILAVQSKNEQPLKDVQQAVLAECKGAGDESDVYLVASRYFRIQLDHEGLTSALRTWLANVPNSSYAHYRYGKYKETRRDWKGASAAYKRSMELNDQYVAPLARNAFCLYKMKKYQDALKVYNQMIELNCMNPARYMHRGECYEALGQYERAAADYTKAIEMETGFTDVAKQIVEMRKREERSQRAFRKWLHLRAAAHEKAGRLDLALKDAKLVVMTFPGDSVGLDVRRQLYEKAGKYDLALKDLDAMIAMNPRVAIWYEARSKVLTKLGKTKQAEEDLKRFDNLKKRGELK